MPHHGTYQTCQQITPDCPLSATTYGYYPNLTVNSFFIAFFSLCLITQLTIGTITRKTTWTYIIALAIGTFGELVGYIGRVMMHYNPWSGTGFKIQICCLVLAPSFIAAAIYLTLKHLVIYCGPEHSKLKPKLYPLVFVGCDFGSIVLQAIGGGVAAGAGDNGSRTLLKAGDDLIVAGIAFQVATMVVCGLFVAHFFYTVQKAKKVVVRGLKGHEKDEYAVDETDGRTTGQLKLFIGAVTIAYFTVLIRCIYRLPEMAGGWGNPLMRKENEFLLLDGMMIGIATLALSCIHPGYFFPPMQRQNKVSSAPA